MRGLFSELLDLNFINFHPIKLINKMPRILTGKPASEKSKKAKS